MNYSLALPPRPSPLEATAPEATAAEATAPEVNWNAIVAGLNASGPEKASAPLSAGVDQHGWSAIVGQLNAELPAAAIRGR